MADGQGVGQVIEPVAGDGLNQSVHATKAAGHISLVGFLGGQTAPLDMLPMLYSQAVIRGIAVGDRRAFLEMNQFIEKEGPEPVIDTVYAFEDPHKRTSTWPAAPSERSSSASRADLHPRLPLFKERFPWRRSSSSTSSATPRS